MSESLLPLREKVPEGRMRGRGLSFSQCTAISRPRDPSQIFTESWFDSTAHHSEAAMATKTTKRTAKTPGKPRAKAAAKPREKASGKRKSTASAPGRLAAIGGRARGILRWPLRIVVFAGVVVLILAIAGWITSRPGNPLFYPPRSGAETITVAVADHGLHAGLILPTDRLRQYAYTDGHQALIEVTERFLQHRWLEIGWGDEVFYRFAPTLGAVNASMAASALFAGERKTVLHVAGVDAAPKLAFYKSDVAEIALSEPGFRVLAARLEESFARKDGTAVDLGEGLYAQSAFYGATGGYSLLSDCNHWVGRMLNAAGVTVWPLLDTLSAGLMVDLRWHAQTK